MNSGVKVEARPWGGFAQFAKNEKCTVKILEVETGEKLSLQSHENRDELWVGIDSGLQIEIDGVKTIFNKNDHVFIWRKSKHRLSAPVEGGRILEVSFGDFDENDEIRYEDAYDRK